MTFLFKLYTSEDELNAANVVECLRLQSTDTLKHWYDNPGMLHRQLQEGIQDRCWFRPPIYFETQSIKKPLDPPDLTVQECGDLEVPMWVIVLKGWHADALEEPP